MAFGVKSNAEINEGQWWRFVIIDLYSHRTVAPILQFVRALIAGPQVEKFYGGARFVILYVLTERFSVYGSHAYHPNTISAGASGAIFDCSGCYLYLNSVSQFDPAFLQARG